MRATRCGLSLAFLVLALVSSAFPAVVRAQDASPRWTFGGGGGVLLPQGAFSDHAGNSGLWEMFLAFEPRRDRPWGARLSLAFSSYAHSDTTYALPGIDADTRTASQVYLVTLGPQWTVGSGRARGVLHASAGFCAAETKTAIRGGTNDVGNTNVSDGALAIEAGGAVSFALTRSERLALEVGGRWFGTGELEYVPRGGIRRGNGGLLLSKRQDALAGVVLRGAVVLAIERRDR